MTKEEVLTKPLYIRLAYLYCIDAYKYDSLAEYISFRIQEYEYETDIFNSFDEYVDYCINRISEEL